MHVRSQKPKSKVERKSKTKSKFWRVPSLDPIQIDFLCTEKNILAGRVLLRGAPHCLAAAAGARMVGEGEALTSGWKL